MAIELVGIGGACIDLNHRSFSSLVQKDSNPGEISLSAGGVMRNICENAAKLGVSTTFVAALGNDIFAKSIEQSCMDASIDISHMIYKDAPSSIYVSLLDDKGDMAIACSDMRISSFITEEDLQQRVDVIAKAKVACIDGNLTAEAIACAATICNQQGVPVFFDPVSTSHARKFKNSLHLFHTAKPNLLELEALTDINVTDEESFRRAVKKLLDSGISRVFVTFGEQGACCATKDGRFYYKRPKPGKMVNATGAGDAFTAALLYCYINNYSEEETLDFAMTAGRVAISCPQTVNPAMSLSLVLQYQNEEDFQ